MSTTTERRTGWTLNGNVAVLSGAHLNGEIDVSCPQAGMRSQRNGASSIATGLLGVHRSLDESIGDVVAHTAATWPLRTTDVYIRGDDLVASYEPAADWPFSPQLYWQPGALRQVQEVLGSLSLLVSVQTQLLDTCPRISVASQYLAGEVLLISPQELGANRAEVITDRRNVREPADICCVLVRPKGGQMTYAELASSSDFHELHIRPEDSGVAIEWRLFSEFLEKGVIRRARVHSVLLPRDSDIDIAVACCQGTKQLELPLTT